MAPVSSPAVIAVGAALVVYIAWKLTYTLFFHPLAKYPGPLLAKITTLYAAYHGWRGDIHLDMAACHERYGDYVRYGPNAILFNNSNGLKDIYWGSTTSKFIKGHAYAPMIHRAPNTLTIRGGKEHARRRRVVAQGVSEKAQRGYEGRVMRHIEEFCDIAMGSGNKQTGTEEWSEPMDMAKWTNYLSFDIMSDVVFGARYELLSNPRFRYVVDSIEASNVRMSVLIQAPWYAALKLDKYIFRDAIKARNRFIKFVVRVMKDRTEKALAMSKDTVEATEHKVEEHDVFANLAAAKDPETGSGFQLDEIAAESTTLIVAGSDTTSTAMGSIAFYLANNADAFAKAAAEVRAAFSTPRDVTMGPALVSCTYLRACIDEALRISPPVGSSLWREVVAPTGSVTIDGQTIPTGADVGVSIYALHHKEEYFPQPYVYSPERWLSENRESVELARAAFNPFSIGMRSCLGKGLAQTELMLTFARILVEGDFRLAAGKLGEVGRGAAGAGKGRERANEYQMWDHVTGQKKGPWLQFSKRTRVDAKS